jgi:REP element-mobilizing transposase RayT
MARPLRILYPGAVYHVMNRGTARQKVFLEAEDYRCFLQTVADCHALWGIQVFAYCLLGNHYHLCFRTPEGNLSRVMRHLDGLYTQRFNRAHRRDGPLFRGRYRALVIEAEAYLAAVVRYIHLNPVEAGIVSDPAAYPWSSHAAYLRPRRAPPWLDVQEVGGRFSPVRAFHAFVLAGNEEALKRFYRGSRQGPVLGGEGFRAWLQGQVQALSREHPRPERQQVRPDVEVVLRAVARAYQVPVEGLLRGRRGTRNEARQVAMYLTQRLCDLTLRETGKRLGVGSYGAVGWACSAVRHALATQRALRRRVEALEARISQQKI